MSALLSEPVQVLVCINILLTLSLLFPFITGVWSLGMSGFMALGAYAASYCSTTLGWSLAASILIGTVTAIVGTIPFGLLALRIRAIYLAIATLSAAELITLFFSHSSPLGGVMGFAGMSPIETSAVISLTLASFAVAVWIFRSRLGKAMIAVGSSPTIAYCTALNVPLLQLTALAIGGAFAGLAGGIFAHYYSFIAPSNFGFNRTVDILLFLVAGGLTPLGAAFGSTVLTLVPQYVGGLDVWAPALYGVVVIVIMAILPDGIFPRNRSRSLVRRLIPGLPHTNTAASGRSNVTEQVSL